MTTGSLGAPKRQLPVHIGMTAMICGSAKAIRIAARAVSVSLSERSSAVGVSVSSF